ncbi:YadA-like family protein [Histophilus somni]|uniref:YadA-like family protein n=2 Tax=Histophilus somni TaxID=731 RepID=UPI003877CBA7
MNKIFKTKYDVTTGQTKVVSELATNRQIASRVEAAGSQPKCGVFFGGMLGAFKVLPLALVMASILSANNVAYGAWLAISDSNGTVGPERSNASNGENNSVSNVVLSKWEAIKEGSNDNTKNSVVIGAGNEIKGLGDGVVVIGVGAKGLQVGTTAVGRNARAMQGQATAFGNNTYANGQSTAIGNDVYAVGKSAIAMGNDDIATVYKDKLPQKTIEAIFKDTNNSTALGGGMKWEGADQFKQKYLSASSGQDNRIYSPTYAKGDGAIAIGSRSIGYGQGSLAMGTLSFALGKESTAVGIRAYVDLNAEGGVAIGDQSRVFAENSFAIGNEAESTSTGSLSFGSQSKAVGKGSIAIGQNVGSNAQLISNADTEFSKIIMGNIQTPRPEPNNENRYTYSNPDDLKFGDQNHIVTLGFAAKNLDGQANPITTLIDKVIKEKEQQSSKKITYAYETDEVINTGKPIYKTKKEGDHAISLGYHLSNNGDNTIAIGTASIVRGSNSVVLGALNNVGKHARNTIALGIGTNIYKENSVAIGTGVNVTGAGVVAIGSGVGVTKDNTIAVGYGAHGLSSESIVLGNSASLKDHASKSIVIGNGAKVENKKKQEKISALRWPQTGDNTELEMSAISIGTNSYVYAEKGIALGNSVKIELDANNSMALGNSAEATMENSVALGYKSHTKYFYQNGNKNTATLRGLDAIELDPYIPEGSSYNLKTDKAAGIVSVGWTKGNQELGLRRIVGVAPGALDSDVVTVGQLKALYYVKKEGVVTYYTKDGNNIIKLTKDADGKFYKVNTKDGTPYKDLGAVDAKNVFVGPKGANEKTEDKMSGGKQYSLGDMGNKIKFAHILDGEIASGSDQAITGNQLHQLGSSILGLTQPNDDKTKFSSHNFTAVNYIGAGTKGSQNTFKAALEETISAINSGYKFSDEKKDNTPFYLGSTIKLVAGDISSNGQNTHLGKNLKTQFTKEDSNATAKFTIGLKDDPEFKTVKLTGNPTDGQHAVNKAYVDEKLQNVSTNLHYLSVKGTDSEKGEGSNYNNDGAKASNSVAIGVSAKVEAPTDTQSYIDTAQPNAEGGVAIGYNAQSKAKNAIVIGTNVSVDIPNSFVLGSNNIVDQNSKGTKNHLKNKYDAKGERDAVVVIGSGTTLKNSKSSIAIGAVNMGNGKHFETDRPIAGTYIENAAWATVIGNKNKIYNGTDIVALGNNITADTDKTDSSNHKANSNLVIIGNGANATKAENSVLIGAKSKATSGAKNAVVIGYQAQSKAESAVVIGDGAIVETAAGESIALGKGSKATEKANAKANATVAGVKFGFTGGIGDQKTVLSIGKSGAERVIKHVAAGAVDKNSTDAINGSQLYAVADEFSKLAVNVLGAEVEEASKTGFKKSTFDVAKYQGSTNTPTQKEMTFKDAIGQNTTAINQGFIFGVGDSTNEQGTHYLGDKLIIKAGAIDKPTTITTSEDGYSPNNIKTHYEKNSKNILIGIKDKPTFKNVIIENGIPEDEEELKKGNYDKHAVNKKYLDKRLEKVAANFTVKGDNPKDGKSYTLDKEHNELNINGDSENITTAVVDDKGIKISLNKELKGITSIANNDTKIELNNGTGGNGTKSIVFTSGDNSKSVTLTGDKFSGVSEIGKDDQAKITFKNNGSNEIDFKAGSTTYKFTDSGLDLASKAITNLASGLDNVVNNGKKDLDELLKLVATNGQSSGSSNDGKLNKAVNVKDLLHVANELKNKGLTFQGNGDDTDKVTRKLGETLKIVGETSSTGSTQTTETAAGNITVAKKNGTTNEADTLEIKLSKNLKGIGSVANGDDVKIELKTTGTSGSNTKSIVFTAGDSSNSVTLTGDKFSGVSEISGKNSKSKLTLGADNATVELAHDKSKLELKDTEATITAGDNAGSIKITSNGSKTIELSPENGAKLTLAKDNGSSNVKATGLSSVGVDETTALIFKNNGSKSAELKVGASTTYKFTESGLDLGNKKLTALASGLNLNSAGTSGNGNEEIIKKILEGNPDGMTSGSNSTSIANNAVNVKDLSQVAKAIVQKGLTFAGNTGSDIKAALGDKITIKGEGTYLTSTAKTSNGSKEIEFSLTKTVTDKLDIITVKDGSDSFALGKNSKIVDKKTAPKGIIPNVGGNSVKITWEHAGTSKSTGSQDMKSVVSVGDTDKERIITHVAAGEVRDGSTDAVNAGQLYSVIEVFGKLGTDVLGAEKNDSGDGFKKTTFTKLMSGDEANGTAQTPAPMTFKDAIEKNIAKINEGLKFKGDTGAEFTRQLGTTVMIKGDGTDLTSKAENGTITFELHKSDKVSTSDQKVVTSKAVDTAIKDIKLSYKANGDTATKQVKLTDGLHFKDGTNTTAVVEESGVVKFSLNEELKNITSISGKSNSGTTPKIEFANGGNGLNPNIKISANGGEFTFDNNGLILNDKQIKGVKSGLGLNGTSGNGTDKSIIEKVLSGNPDGTTAGSNGTSIANNAINAQDLSTVAKALLDKGLTFKVDNGTSADSSTKTEMTKALGQAVTFKGDGKYLTTKLNDTNGEISFNLSVAESISDTSTGGDSTQNTTNSKLVTENAVKNFVTHKINNLSSTLQLEGDNSNSKDFGKVELKTEKLKLTGEADEIITEVTKDDPSVKIKLAQKVKDKLAIINVGENTNDDNSFALGQNSTLEAKKLAPSGATPNVGSNDVTITWNTAGASKDKNDLREVVSVGSADKERIITHVAAGAVQSGSTDAINGGQLHSVIDVFGKLGLDVLGAEKADNGKDGFKQSKFDEVKTSDNATASNPEKSEKTFKKAIEDNIAAINKGLKFAGDNDGEKQLYLGSTLNIKGAKGEASSAGSNSASSDTTNNHQNIFTKASDTGLEIALNEALQGISSISGKKGTDGSAVAKIALDNDEKTITFSSGNTPAEVTLKGSTFSGVSEINKAEGEGALKLANSTATLESASGNSNVALKANEATVTAGTDKGSLKLEAKKATLESAKDGSNVALDDTSATLSAGNGKGSIKVATGSGDGDNKIELSPEKDVTVTLEKDGTNGVKAKGLSTVGLDGDNALVFTNGASGTDKMAKLKVGGAALTFTPTNGTGNAKTVKISNVAVGNIATDSKDAITGGQLHDLASKLGVEVESETGFKQPSFTAIKGGTSSTGDTGPTTFKGAIDDLITAVNGGLTFKGNDDKSTQTTLQLGGILTIDSSTSIVGSGANGAKSTTEKDITVSLMPNDKDVKDAGTLTLTLNKATSVSDSDEKVVTSKAVATELKNYTKTAELEEKYLKVDGANIDENQKVFGANVGIEKINLEEDETEGTSELVQAKALVSYLKGTGEKSVKLSDSSKTQAIGEGSISIGYNAVSRNEGSIAMGYNSEASNSGAISIGQGSTVLGVSSVAVGKENDVKGNFSFVLGEGNTLDKEQTYVIGSDNKISGAKNIAIGLGNTVGGNENIVLGSHVDLKDDVEGAIVLGDKSIGVSNAVSVGNALTKRRIVFVDTPQGEYDAVNKKYVDDLTLTYKSNNDDKTKKSINLKTEALDFKKATNDNIQVVVDENGSIQHNLANNLKDVTSISGGTDESGAKITLESSKKEISLNGSKLKGLTDGEIKDDSTDVITGKQLADLAGKLGVGVNKGKTKFTAPIFEYLSNVDGSFNDNPITLKGAIDEARAKLNEGLKFGGDIPSAGTNTNNTHYLGSTINIVSLGTPTGGAVAPTSTDDYSGSNLITQYTYDKGNAKIEIGFKDAPTFSKVTLSAPQTYGNGKGVEDNDLITKSYLEQALNSFKFNVEYGTEKVQIGRNDTLKFNAGLNIQLTLAKEGEKPENGATPTSTTSAETSTLAPTTAPTTVNTPSGSENGGAGNMASSGNTSPAVASSGSDAGDTGATVGSSTTPTTAPINNGSTGSDSAVTSSTTSSNGAGTDGGSGTSSTASSGATPSTTTAGTASSTPSTTSNTTAVVTIGTTEELKGLKSAEFNGDNGNTTNITGNEIVLKDQAGNAHTQTATSQIITDNTDPDKEKAVVTTAEGVTMSVVSDDQVLVNDQTAEANVLSNGKHTTEVKAGEVAIKDKSGQEIVSLKIAKGEDGQDGKGATLAFAKGTDGKSGTGTITGLKDLDATADGSSAANKNYVDEKVSDLDSNRPFDFYIKEGNSYTKVIKGRDGKFYDPKDLEGAKYDGSKYTSKDGETIETSLSAEDKVIIRAEPTTVPIGMNNVASGLGLADPETDPNKVEEAKAETAKLEKDVTDKKAAVSEKAKALSEQAKKATDWMLVINGLEQAMNAMPEGEDKKKLQTQLEKNKKQLEKAKEELGKAKTALTEAQTELTKANADYEANYKGYEKVADLVKPDSQADLTNVATIADVQAVAKSGMKFKGNDGVEVRKQLSETLSITGEGTFNSDNTAAGNIKVEMAQDGKGLEVKLSDQLKNMTSFETREVEGRKSTLDSNGLRVVNKGKDGTDDKAKSATYGAEAVVLEDKNKSDKAVMTAGGIRFADSSTQATALSTELNKNGLTVNGAGGQIHIDGTKGVITVPNIKPNADGHVVVNKNYVDTKNNELRTQMNNNDRNMRAGVAQAVAQANLPINILPGKSTLSLATGNYMGSQAFAVGYSRVSDNGKLSVKFSLGHGDKKTSVGAGVGYSW